MKVHPRAIDPALLAVLIVLSATSATLFDVVILVGVLVGRGSVVNGKGTKSTGEANVELNIVSPARSLIAESMLARVFVVNEIWKT